jgi:hypothetical protein
MWDGSGRLEVHDPQMADWDRAWCRITVEMGLTDDTEIRGDSPIASMCVRNVL